MFKKIIICFSLILCSFINCNQAMAQRGDFKNMKCYKQWCSGYLIAGNNYVLRMGTTYKSHGETILFVIDFSPDMSSYTAQLMTSTSDKAKVDGEKIYVDTRIDTKPIFKNVGVFSAQDGDIFINLGNGFGRRFVEEAKQGSTVRIKIHNDGVFNPVYIHFSLHGFTAAFNRLLSMVSLPDSQYF